MASNYPPGDVGHLELVWQSDPSVRATIVDIVAVHGLGTHSPLTWEACNYDPSKANINWLRDDDMLPSVVPNARILTFDYDADYHNDAPVTSLLALGDKLVQILSNYRAKDKTAGRPLIFIGSCFGGLVVVQALQNAAQSSNPHYELFRSTAGVVFLGTPLQGTRVARFETWRVMIEGILGKDSSPSLVKDLSEKSENLRNLTGNFAEIAVNNSLRIHCFYETRKSTILRAILPRFTAKLLPSSRVILVEKDNAHILGHPNTAIDVPHSMINKFRSPTDRGFELVSSCIRNFVESLSQFFDGRRNVDTTAPWTVPFARDHNFVGREDIIEKVLNAMTTPDSHRRMALTGFGGMGKTGIANEFAFRLRELHPKITVLWVYATSRDRFEESFHLIAEALKIPGRADKDNDILQLVDAWLQKSTTGQWIIILDNADDPKVLKSISCSSSTSKKSNPRPLIDFVPRSINGAVLVTSRNKQAARDICGNTTLLDVEKMESSDAILLLQKKLPQDKVESAQEDKFAKLAEELDCIPLAMIHAAAYMTREDIDAKTYLELLQQSSTTMLNQKLEDMWRDTRIPHSVISTWQVSFQQIQAHNPQAIELLFLMSLLDRQSISEELTRGEFYAEPCNDAAEKLSKSWSLQEYVEACGLLLAFGFVSDLKTGEFRSFYMHRLVQSCVRHWMAISADTFYWELRALNLLARSFPHGFFGTWPKCAEFLPHAYQIMRSTTDSKYDGPEKACLLRNVANYERGQGHWDIAEKMITQSVAILQRLEHSDILESQRALARLLLEKGQYLAAESLALHVIERAVEPRLAASCKLVLANAMLEQGRYNDAIEILRPFVEATEIDSGPEKSFRLLCLPSFAVCLGQLGQYKEQGRICRPVLSARENSLGPRHHDTLLANLELATALSRQGEHKDAEKFRRQALSELKKILGIGHPTTLKLEANLAMDFVKEGKYAEAESLCRQVLKVQEMSLGPEQVGTLRTVDNLARAILSQGRHGEAEKLFERALIGKEKALGLDHPNTLRSAQNLAVALRDQGKYNEAEKLYRRALIGREKVLGPEHEDTLRSLRCLAFSLLRQDKHEEAEEHYQQALTGHETVLGLEHKDTMHCLRYLAFALSCQNKHKEAETVYQQALKRHEKVLGSDHENTLDCLRLLAFSQLRQDKLEEAEIVFQQAFMRHKKVLGLENKHTLWVLSGLDECKRQRVQKRKPIYDLRDRPGYEKRQRRSE